MKSSKQHPLTGTVEVDEMVVGQQEEHIVGRASIPPKINSTIRGEGEIASK